jgi:hypothetical protein
MFQNNTECLKSEGKSSFYGASDAVEQARNQHGITAFTVGYSIILFSIYTGTTLYGNQHFALPVVRRS